MWLTCARWLRRAAAWCDPGWALVDPTLVQMARIVVEETDRLPHTSAYKRAVAFKALRARSQARGKDLALAIELALR